MSVENIHHFKALIPRKYVFTFGIHPSSLTRRFSASEYKLKLGSQNLNLKTDLATDRQFEIEVAKK